MEIDEVASTGKQSPLILIFHLITLDCKWPLPFINARLQRLLQKPLCKSLMNVSVDRVL